MKKKVKIEQVKIQTSTPSGFCVQNIHELKQNFSKAMTETLFLYQVTVADGGASC